MHVRPLFFALTPLFLKLTIVCVVAAFYLLVFSIASAQTGTLCNHYLSGTAAPAGYGAAWNPLTSARELLLSSACTSAGAPVSYTVGVGNANHYVYKQGYFYTTAWQSFTLSGTFVQDSTDWLSGKGTYMNSSPPSTDYFWVGYVCQWTNGQWKCGCRDSACTTNYWQLQQVKYPSSGGTTGGSASGQAACQGAVSVMNHGAKGDGSTDDTSKIEAALAANSKVLLPSGKTFIVDLLEIPSNKTLCGYGATLKLKPFTASNSVAGHSVVVLGSVNDVKLYGVTVDGNRNAHNFTYDGINPGGENGRAHGIRSDGATQVTIQDVIVKNSVIDGLYMRRESRDWTVKNFRSENNGRQAISIISVRDVVFEDCVLTGTNGRTPGAGVDIEPNSSTSDVLFNIRFTRCEFSNNKAGRGLVADNRAVMRGLIIEDSTFFGNAYEDLVVGGREGAGSENTILRRNKLQKSIFIKSTGGSNPPPATHKNMVIEKNEVGQGIQAKGITSNSAITVRNNCVGGSISGFPSGTLTQSNNGANGCK